MQRQTNICVAVSTQCAVRTCYVMARACPCPHPWTSPYPASSTTAFVVLYVTWMPVVDRCQVPLDCSSWQRLQEVKNNCSEWRDEDDRQMRKGVMYVAGPTTQNQADVRSTESVNSYENCSDDVSVPSFCRLMFRPTTKRPQYRRANKLRPTKSPASRGRIPIFDPSPAQLPPHQNLTHL